MTLPDQWKYLDAWAQKMKRAGDEDGYRKMMACRDTIKDLWVEAHRETLMTIADMNDETVMNNMLCPTKK